MFVFLMFVHLFVCLALIGVVLMQSGKGGGLAGGAFGGSAQTVFGGRGATDFITRATMVLGGAFFLTSLTLALMSAGITSRPTRSVIQEEARKAGTAPSPLPPQSAPGQPGAPAGAPAVGGSAPAGTPATAPTTAPAAPAAPSGGTTAPKPASGGKPPGGR